MKKQQQQYHNNTWKGKIFDVMRERKKMYSTHGLIKNNDKAKHMEYLDICSKLEIVWMVKG